jgi:hypothetical protein
VLFFRCIVNRHDDFSYPNISIKRMTRKNTQS